MTRVIQSLGHRDQPGRLLSRHQPLHEKILRDLQRIGHRIHDFCDVAAERAGLRRAHTHFCVQCLRQLRRGQATSIADTCILNEDQRGARRMQHVRMKYVRKKAESRPHRDRICIAHQSNIIDSRTRRIDCQLFRHGLDAIRLAQSGLPFRLGNTGLCIGAARQHEEEIGQTIQINQDKRLHAFVRGEIDDCALRTARYRTRQV
jgi:hypothetical protein